MALRGEEGGDWAWEYDAPQFVDFSKLSSSDLINDEEYFNMDHELKNPVSKIKVITKSKTVNRIGCQITSTGAESKKLNNKPVELINPSKIKQESNKDFHICKTDAEFKENIKESSLVDSTSSSSKLPDTLSLKTLKLSDVFLPSSPMGKIQVIADLENKLVETQNRLPTVPCSLETTSILEDKIYSKLSPNEMEGTLQNVLCYTESKLSALDKEIVTNSDPEPEPNKSCSQKMGKIRDDRGRTINRNCRQVDEVTSAKKRLSMSVDRGRDRLRLLSPSPPFHREASLERKKNSIRKKTELPAAIPRSYGNGACHSLVFHKTRSTVKSQTIVESQNEMMLDEKEFVRGLTENNIEVVEEERLNRTGVVPHTGVPFQLLGTQRVTLPAPFSFEERTKQMMMKKKEKIRKFLETERKAHEFHAQPFPEILYSAAQPKKMVKPVPKPPTKPVPFQLHLPNPPSKQAAIIEEPKQTFRAKPAKVLHKEPFIPQKASQRTTAFLPPSLCTKQRAEKRAEWDRLMQEKEIQTEQERLITERQQKEEGERELRKLRAATVHKANPIRHYKLVAVVHSTKSPTIPKSPTFSRKAEAI